MKQHKYLFLFIILLLPHTIDAQEQAYHKFLNDNTKYYFKKKFIPKSFKKVHREISDWSLYMANPRRKFNIDDVTELKEILLPDQQLVLIAEHGGNYLILAKQGGRALFLKFYYFEAGSRNLEIYHAQYRRLIEERIKALVSNEKMESYKTGYNDL